MVQPLNAGNALRLFLQPPTSAVRWRVLRKGSDTFSGPDDANAFVAFEGDDKVFVDAAFLQNEVRAFYRPYYTTNGSDWIAGPTASGTPVATYKEKTSDVLSFLRDRLEAGLKVECERGTFSTDLGYVQVFTATPSLERDLSFPLVTVHLEDEDSSVRAIGDDIAGDGFNEIDQEWIEAEGWMDRVSVTLIGWSLNSDERLELRKALRRIIIANLPVFSDKGWQEISLNQKDVDAVSGEYPAHIFQVFSTFSCIAPVAVTSAVRPIKDVTLTMTAY